MKPMLFRIAVVCFVAVALGMAAYAWRFSFAVNDLGLTRFDLKVGELKDVEELQAKAERAADAYLALHTTELQEVCGGPFQLALSYALAPKIRSLGHRSSFYYYCWNIYLPYSLQTNSGKTYFLAVQLSDGTNGSRHDPDQFHVLRTVIIDQKDLSSRTISAF